MGEQPLLSICIPTYKRSEILRNTLRSIYLQDVNHSLFEVCISDDSPDEETEKMIIAEFNDVDNLVYKHIPDCGYINMIYAVRMGNGLLLKANNDYNMWNDGALQRMINIIYEFKDEKPLIWFRQENSKNENEIQRFSDYDSFIDQIDIFCTWVGAFAIWKEDIEKYDAEGLQLCDAFPHTSYLFRMSDKSNFIVNNFPYVTRQTLKTKGGYNLPDYFVRQYLSMVKKDLLDSNVICKDTYEKLKNTALKFTAEWYWNIRLDDTYTFKFENDEKIIKETCGNDGYKKYKSYRGGVLLKVQLRYIKNCIKKLIRRI